MIPIDIFDQKEEYLGHLELSFIPPLGSTLAFKGEKYIYQGKVAKIEIDMTSDSPLVEIEIDGGIVGL